MVALLQQPAQPLAVLHEHSPPEHSVPDTQETPQAPQSLLLVSRFTQAVGSVVGHAV